MKNTLIGLLLALLALPALAEQGLYGMKIKSASKGEIKLADYKEKALLIVNIATRCGYTGQLDELEELYKKYKDKGLAVIGIPSNDFGGQTPEEDKKVAEFCRLKYGATFPISIKVGVTGKDKHELVDYVVESAGGGEIKWNFEKFLFDKNGKFVARFRSSIEPEDEKLVEAVKKTLK